MAGMKLSPRLPSLREARLPLAGGHACGPAEPVQRGSWAGARGAMENGTPG
jgi:hypothetical protein